MSVVDNVKEIADLIKKVNDIELYRKIVELENEVFELVRAKRKADERIEELTRHNTVVEVLARRGAFYFHPSDSRAPYCSHCVEVHRLAVHLTKGDVYMRRRKWSCPKCDNEYVDHDLVCADRDTGSADVTQ